MMSPQGEELPILSSVALELLMRLAGYTKKTSLIGSSQLPLCYFLDPHLTCTRIKGTHKKIYMKKTTVMYNLCVL